jgi:predicted homoserine dehydrogenase-like protein
MAQGLANTIVNSVPGMQVSAIYGRRLERAIQVYEYAGVEDSVEATTQGGPEDAVRAGTPVVTDDAFLLCARSKSMHLWTSVKVFCLAEHSDPNQRHYLSLYKLGDGPLYGSGSPITYRPSRHQTRSCASCFSAMAWRRRWEARWSRWQRWLSET